MNCKPGDLAIVVKSVAGNEGRILTVLRWIGHIQGFSGNDWWETDVEVRTLLGGRIAAMRDSFLRPIRPQSDGARDETLGWLPVPTKETEAA